jgi:hypothetical protein
MPNCRDCHAPIKFARLGGRTIPVDASSTSSAGADTGAVVLFHDFGVLKARPARLPEDYSRPRHRIHFDTCKTRRYRKAPQR